MSSDYQNVTKVYVSDLREWIDVLMSISWLK